MKAKIDECAEKEINAEKKTKDSKTKASSFGLGRSAAPQTTAPSSSKYKPKYEAVRPSKHFYAVLRQKKTSPLERPYTAPSCMDNPDNSCDIFSRYRSS